MSSDFSSFLVATAEKELAQERYSHASVALDIAGIRHRLAEIKSQHEPLGSLLNSSLPERDRLFSAAFYVVVGRMPEK